MAHVLIVEDSKTQAEAIRQAKDIASVTGRAVIQPHLTDGIINGDATSVNDLDTLVQDNVVVDPIVRVKIWAPDGTIVYSDEPELIGRRFSLGAEELAVLRTSGVEADVSDLRDPENLFAGYSLSAYGLLVNTSLVAPEDRPRSWKDLANPKYRGKILMREA